MLSKEDQIYLDALWRKIRKSTIETINALNEWERRSDEVNDLLDREGVTDIVQRNKIRGENLGLQSAYSKWNFFQANVTALSAALQAEYYAPKLLGLED